MFKKIKNFFLDPKKIVFNTYAVMAALFFSIIGLWTTVDEASQKWRQNNKRQNVKYNASAPAYDSAAIDSVFVLSPVDSLDGVTISDTSFTAN